MTARRTSIASLVAAVAVTISLVIAAWSLPIDDFWLSIASGRAIATGADPTAAIDFTWTPTIPDALNPQWAAQVLLGAHGSLSAALALNSSLILAALALTLMRTASRASGAATAVSMLLSVAALAPHVLARAQSFSLALTAASLLLLERGRGRAWLPPTFAVIVAVWANLHGAFVVGVLAAAAFFIGSIVQRRHGRLVYALTAIAALVAPLANPVGSDLFAYVLSQPASDIVRAISVEWQPAWPWIPVAALFWALLAIVVVGRWARPRAASFGELLLLAALATLAVSAIRHLPWFILAAAPLVASDVEAFIHRSPRLDRAVGSLGPWWRTEFRRVAVALVVLAVVIQPVRTALPQGIGRVTPDAPLTLVDALSTAVAGDSCCHRVLNEQVWGGYLAYRLADRVETAMDGRLEIRARDTWQRYFDLLHGVGDPAAALRAEGVEWAMVREDRARLIAALRAADWEVIERSAKGVLLRAAD